MDMVEEVFSYDAMYHPASCPSKGLNLTRIYIPDLAIPPLLLENGPVDGIAALSVLFASIPTISGCTGITERLRQSERVPLVTATPLRLLRFVLAG